MSNFTYRQLKKQIEKFNDEQLDSDVSVYLAWENEYFEIEDVTFATSENDILDSEHPILYVDDGSGLC